MDLGQWLTLATYAGLLALGVVAILRVRVNPLAGPLAALCCISFIWNFAVWAHGVSGSWVWIYVDRTASPWTCAAALAFVLTFVGQRRRYRSLVLATNLLFGVLSAIAAAGFVSEWGRAAAVSAAWNNVFAALIVTYLGVAAFVLGRHWIEQRSVEERMRTRLVVAGVVANSVMGVIELLIHDHLTVPAMLIAVVLMTVVAFDFNLFGSKLTGMMVVYAIALAIIAGGSYVIAFATFEPAPGPTALAVFAITLCWIAPALAGGTRERAAPRADRALDDAGQAGLADGARPEKIPSRHSRAQPSTWPRSARRGARSTTSRSSSTSS